MLPIRVLLILFTIGFTTVISFAQTVAIIGNDNVNINSSHNYLAQLDPRPNFTGSTWLWQATGGSVSSSGSTSCTVLWTGQGTQLLTYQLETIDNYYYNTKSVNVIAPTPQIPTSLAVTSPSATQFSVSWSAVSGASGYTVRVVGPGVETTTNFLSNQTTGIIDNLLTDRVYQVSISASNSFGPSNYSEPVVRPIRPTSPNLEPLANITSNSVTLSWNPNPIAHGYQVQLSPDETFSSLVQQFSLDNTQTSLTVGNLQPATPYYARARTHNFYGEYSIFSNSRSATTLPVPPLAPVALPATSKKSDSFVAHWSSVPNAASYELHVAKDPGFQQIVRSYTGVQTTTQIVSSLLEKVTYYYRVRASNPGGHSDYSNIIRAIDLDQNFIRAAVAHVPNLTNIAELEEGGNLPENVAVTYQFYDGLGRLIQSVGQRQSPERRDIITPMVYDGQGREATKYLPYVDGTDGWFKGDFKPIGNTEYNNAQSSPQFKFYQSTAAVATDTRPFSSVEFEASPLSRPLKEYGPGAAWSAVEGANRYIGHGYKINVHGTGEEMERIVAWRVNGNGVLGRESAVTGFIQDGGYYATGQIWIKETSDEARHRVREYSDKQGRVILKKVQVVEPALVNNDSHWAQTYYIYDDFGNLVMVLPPEAVKALTE